MSETRESQDSPSNVCASNGIVIAPHWKASEAGIAVLKRGGNAIEALVAASAALSVVYPHFCGLGGDAVWMLADTNGAVSSLMGIGQAGQCVGSVRSIPQRGPGSALTTACLVDSWDVVLRHSAASWAGTESLAQLLEPAICLAQDGFEVSASQRFWFDFRVSELNSWQGFGSTFVGSGLQRQPHLAEILRLIAKNGARDFYEGEIAARIARGLTNAGAVLTAADLASTRAVFEKPESLGYRDLTLFAPPPPTQGATTLAIMGVLNHLDVAAENPDSAGYYHLLVEAVKQAFLDRHLIADPAFVGSDAIGKLLDPDRLAEKSKKIDQERALTWPHLRQEGDTSFLAAVDSQGRCACVLQSIYFDWGSGLVVGDTGIVWQNRGAGFSLDPQSPNCLQPGKRPFYTLNPGIALKGGRPHLLYGTQGADGQPQTLSLLLSLLIDHAMTPASALARPRFLLGKTFSDSRDTLKLENDAGSDVFAGLAERGHEISGIEPLSPLGGQAGIIRIDSNGGFCGAHDPRSDGGAIGY